MADEVIEYLGEKVAAELLSTIDGGGSQFGELEDALGVSSTTLSKRITQGEELGLIDTEAVTGEQGRTHVYVLTPKGARVRFMLEQTGAAKTYRLLQTYRSRVEDEVAEVEEELEKLGDDLDDKQENYQYLSHHRRDSRLSDRE